MTARAREGRSEPAFTLPELSTRLNKVDLSRARLRSLIGVDNLRGVTVSHGQLLDLAAQLAAQLGIEVRPDRAGVALTFRIRHGSGQIAATVLVGETSRPGRAHRRSSERNSCVAGGVETTFGPGSTRILAY